MLKTYFPGARRGLLLALGLAATVPALAQRGVPPRHKTRTVFVTKYAQHLDFLPEMVKLLKVPAGWQVSVAASGLGRPRMLYPAPNGGLYITRRDGGDVLLLKDADGDSKFEDLVTVAADFKGVHGITAREGWLYLCNDNLLRRYRQNPDGSLGAMETLISDLPNGGQHPNRTMAFGPDGMLYLSVGSECNDCKEANKEMASMLRIDPATWKRTMYATGLRNTIGFDWHPSTHELWGIDNGGDGKGNKWPPEEVNHIVQGGVYGFPFVYGKREVDQSREDPAGDIKEEYAKNTVPSVLELGAHQAPIGFTFFGAARNIPAEYANDGLVCWHGSWARSKPVGFKVQRIRFQNGEAVAAEDFLTGFLKPGLLMFKRKARFGRPAGITVTPAGVVYVSDDANGVLYAIKRTNANETAALPAGR
jgi:glucose/arabinose dehydrogenase